jgi:hypothetical protein
VVDGVGGVDDGRSPVLAFDDGEQGDRDASTDDKVAQDRAWLRDTVR